MKNFFWPSIDTEEDAKKAIRMGASGCFVVALVTGVLAVLQMRGILKLIPGLDGYALIDSAIFSIVGIFILRGSRVAAVAGLLLYVGGQYVTMRVAGIRFSPMMLILTVYFINGIRGAFEYHEMKRGTSPPPSKFPVSFALLLILLTVFGAAVIFFYRNSPKIKIPAPPSFSVRLPKLKAPKLSVFKPHSLKPAPEENQPAEKGSSEKKTLKLKDGRTLSGKIIYEDETYYSVETLTGTEVIIKEDVADS